MYNAIRKKGEAPARIITTPFTLRPRPTIDSEDGGLPRFAIRS